ncbi:hypothetical protein RhiirA4_457852 [Rhizophagus irregularis]|uniref:Uncharacterized protein n=1 Tax=Rhizophagus irregularis TaxID=588596 RepID=A0A2I1GAY2_9GLOM|nr:hypothetical protein RhiirA4_457852 [Rhizophagus irregularis]
MDEIFLKGGSNIALTKNDRTYFFRMFDAKLSASAIKRRYEWQAYKKLNKEESEKRDYEVIKEYNKVLGGHFSKAIYRSTMDDDLGKGLQMKSQDELIDRFKVPTQTKRKDEFVDAQSDPISTIPRTEEEHEELDSLNNNFSNRLDEVNKIPSLPNEKGKKKEEDKDKINENKKRVVTTQGRREDSDSE